MSENINIRIEARASGIPLWKVADSMGISEPTLYRKLRHELPEEEKMKILDVIERLKEERTNG